MLADPIKELGDYQVPVKLTKNVTAMVSVSVIGEDGTTAPTSRRARRAALTHRRGEATDESAPTRMPGRTRRTSTPTQTMPPRQTEGEETA